MSFRRGMRGRLLLYLIVVFVTASVESIAQEDLVIADFESRRYGDWAAVGDAFGDGPALGTLPGQMDVTGYQGRRLVNSFHGGDGTTGTLTSAPFTVQRRRICFLIGGGMHPGETCINLLVDGQVVRTATGPNDRPGGSERLAWQCWDVDELNGREATIEIVDRHTGGWGHVNIDQIVQCDEAPVREGKRAMNVEKRYLNLPVKNGASMRRMQILTGSEVVREFDIELADGEPDFWAFLDLAPFEGQEIVARIDALERDSRILDGLVQEDVIRGTENLYREPLRPQFHFSSRRGWNNDPNGLVFHDGEYHLYYQHNPYGWKWGNMHWGHALSTDLVHWTELPIALYPAAYGDWVFSGSAVIDVNNTAGFKTGAEDVVVAAYTSTGRGECIAYSNDKGRTFTDYAGNPVVKHTGRDPKVIWHEPTAQWVMAVYDEQEGKKNGISFYTSGDLKTWTYQSRLEEYFECPEIFAMAVDGDAANTRWIVYAANGAHSIGAFDGRVFTPESGPHPFNFGNCFYASQTYNNIPAEDGRRVQIGWGTINIPDMPFNQMMTFPCELTLRSTGDGIRMFARPVREIELLHGAKQEWANEPLAPGANPLERLSGDLFHIIAALEPGKASEIGLAVRGVPIRYDVAKAELACGDKTAALALENGHIRLELLVDRVSIEIFANDGRVYMPMGMIFDAAERGLEVYARGGEANIAHMQVYEMNSAWPR